MAGKQDRIELGRSPTAMERLVHAGVEALIRLADSAEKGVAILGEIKEKVDDLAEQVALINNTLETKGGD